MMTKLNRRVGEPKREKPQPGVDVTNLAKQNKRGMCLTQASHYCKWAELNKVGVGMRYAD